VHGRLLAMNQAGAVEFALSESDSIDEHLARARSAIEIRFAR